MSEYCILKSLAILALIRLTGNYVSCVDLTPLSAFPLATLSNGCLLLYTVSFQNSAFDTNNSAFVRDIKIHNCVCAD